MALSGQSVNALKTHLDVLIGLVNENNQADIRFCLQAMLRPEVHFAIQLGTISGLIQTRFPIESVLTNQLRIVFNTLHDAFGSVTPQHFCIPGHIYFDTTHDYANTLLERKQHVEKQYAEEALEKIGTYSNTLQKLNSDINIIGKNIEEYQARQSSFNIENAIKFIKQWCNADYEWMKATFKDTHAAWSYFAKAIDEAISGYEKQTLDTSRKAIVIQGQAISNYEKQALNTIRMANTLFFNLLNNKALWYALGDNAKDLLLEYSLKRKFYLPEGKLESLLSRHSTITNRLYDERQSLEGIAYQYEKENLILGIHYHLNVPELSHNIARKKLARTDDFGFENEIPSPDQKWFEHRLAIYMDGTVIPQEKKYAKSRTFFLLREGAFLQAFKTFQEKHQNSLEGGKDFPTLGPSVNTLSEHVLFFNLVAKQIVATNLFSSQISFVFYQLDFYKVFVTYFDKIQVEEDPQKIDVFKFAVISQLRSAIYNIVILYNQNLIYDLPQQDKDVLKYYNLLIQCQLLDTVGFLIPKIIYFGNSLSDKNIYQLINTLIMFEKPELGIDDASIEEAPDNISFDTIYNTLIEVRKSLQAKLDAQKTLLAARSLLIKREEKPIQTPQELAALQRKCDEICAAVCDEYEKEKRLADEQKQSAIKIEKEKSRAASTKNRTKARETLQNRRNPKSAEIKQESAPRLVPYSEPERLYRAAYDFLKSQDSEKAILGYKTCIEKAIEEQNHFYVAAACLELSETYSMRALAAIPDFSGQVTEDKSTKKTIENYNMCVSYAEQAFQYFKTHVYNDKSLLVDEEEKAALNELSVAIHLCLARANKNLESFITKHNAKVYQRQEQLQRLLIERDKIKAARGEAWYQNTNPSQKFADFRQKVAEQVTVSKEFSEEATTFSENKFKPIQKVWALLAGKESTQLGISNVKEKSFLERLALASGVPVVIADEKFRLSM